jgi:ubiquinone/menaquinone biosynthesis C-methylase UbiE
VNLSSDQKPTDWNGAAGQSWVAAQDALDEMFRPFEDLLVSTAAARPRTAVLDVGCGTGSTTIALQKRLGPAAACVGVDISQPMLEHARSRCGQDNAPTFVCADAETHAFERERFDLLVSRFGVMFFKDSVQALANLRLAARSNAELCFIVWRGPAENPFMTTAERAAAGILPNIPPRVPDAPGQFGFADPQRVRRILEQSGWSNIGIEPLDVTCSFPEPALAQYATRLGPLGGILRKADEQLKARVLAVVRPAFEAYVHGELVRFTAACWKISAQALKA